MRKSVLLLSAALLALLLLVSDLQAQFTQDQLDTWQAVAATYYEEGVDENFLLGDIWQLPHSWGYVNPSMIKPGMIAPDFTLYDLDANEVTLSQFKGNAFVVHITGSWYWPPYLRNWVPNNKILEKFANFPVVMLDIYGRERHPEATSSDFIQESYNDRRQRAELMLWTFKQTTGGTPPANRYILLDEDPAPELLAGPYGTMVTHMYGGRPQGGIVIDLNGKIILNQVWERPEQIDEVLSNIFGVETGF